MHRNHKVKIKLNQRSDRLGKKPKVHFSVIDTLPSLQLRKWKALLDDASWTQQHPEDGREVCTLDPRPFARPVRLSV